MSFANPKWFERFPRTIAKAVTWRSWMMVTNSVIGWIVAGNPWKGLTIGLMALVINSTLYLLHERLWNRNDWNRRQTTATDRVVI
jgi:uncharacterized membrane protein|tara:strand:+ start:965 stop:1219 length:255 start_codon:yes stop_codon:yes gene_type:complete